MTLKNCRILMNADIVYDYSGVYFVKSFMRREGKRVRPCAIPQTGDLATIASQNEEGELAGVICIEHNIPIPPWNAAILASRQSLAGWN